MQLVVKISEDTFFDLKKKQNRTEVDNAVLNGRPLPKGHGKLIDENDFEKRIAILTHSMDLGYGEIMDVIDDTPPIIEADAVESEE